MRELSKLLMLAALIAGIVAIIETIPALLQSFAYLFGNILATDPQTIAEIVTGDGFLRQFGPGFLFRFHGMYAVKAVPLFLGASIALAWISYLVKSAHVESKKRLDAEESERKHLQAQQLAASREKVVAAQNRIAQLEAFTRRANEVSKELPSHLKNASNLVSLAEREFNDGVLDPFWDAVESATRSLAEFHQRLAELAASLRKIRELKLQCDAEGYKITDIPMIKSDLSDAIPIATRLAAVVRKSQRCHDFTSIFHVRRTNAILIEGFTTFGQALSEMSTRLNSAINDVNISVLSLENTVHNVGFEITSAINDSAQSHRSASDELESSFERLTSTVKVQSDRSARSDEKIVDILDNIQRDRTPTDLDYKPGTVKKTR